MARILAVDDNQDNVYLLKMILENHDHEIIPAYSGKEALEIVRDTPVDLILLDLMMPEMNGLEVAERLKKMESTRHVPVILLTAQKKETQKVVEALDSGADEYISKPFHEMELVARIKSMLRMKSLFDQLDRAGAMMREELRMAQLVQVSMLPSTFPYPDKLKVNAYYEATMSLGGDYYDVMDCGDGKLEIIMADVSGHGASAALIVSMLKTLMVSSMDKNMPPAKLATFLNDKMLNMIPEDRYLTMFLASVDLNRRKISYVRAGHPFPFLLDKENRSVKRLEARGDVIGLFEGVEVEQGELDFKPGDRLFTYSDGLFEVWDTNGIMYGIDRLEEDLENSFDMDGADTVNLLVDKIMKFNSSDIIEDDVAILLMEFL